MFDDEEANKPMSYEIQHHTNPRAIVLKMHGDFDVSTDVKNYYVDLIARLDAEDSPICLIVDTLDYSISLYDLMQGTKVSLDNGKTPFQHPNVKKLIAVSANRLVQLSVDGFVKFGIIKSVEIVSSMDRALALVD